MVCSRVGDVNMMGVPDGKIEKLIGRADKLIDDLEIAIPEMEKELGRLR